MVRDINMSQVKDTDSPHQHLNKVIISYLPNTQFKAFSRRQSPGKLAIGSPRTTSTTLPGISRQHSVEHEIVRLECISGRVPGVRDHERRPSLVSNQSASCPDLYKQEETDTRNNTKEHISPRILHRKLVPHKTDNGWESSSPLVDKTHFIPSPPKSAAANGHNAKSNNRHFHGCRPPHVDHGHNIRDSTGSLSSNRGHPIVSKSHSDGIMRPRANTVDTSTYSRPRLKLRDQRASFGTPPMTRRKGYVLRVDSQDKIDVSNNIKELSLTKDHLHTEDVSQDLVHDSSKVSTISNNSRGPRHTPQTRVRDCEDENYVEQEQMEEELGPTPQIVVKCQNWLRGLEKANKEKCLDDIACITYTHM